MICRTFAFSIILFLFSALMARNNQVFFTLIFIPVLLAVQAIFKKKVNFRSAMRPKLN